MPSQGQGKTDRFTPAHDDMKGIISSALVGATQYTLRQYRTTKIVCPHMANTDVLSFSCQIYHRKKLGTNADSFHLHYIPIASANGTIVFDWAWGWYNIGDIIPATLPNTGSTTITLATTDQYKYKIDSIITNMTPPTNEGYGSYLLVSITRNGGTWGASNEIAILDSDAHVLVDRTGSYNEYTD